MSRAILIVLDSVGCGGAPDAAAFGDEGANTLLHIAETCARGDANNGRHGPLALPNLESLGLSKAVELASGTPLPGMHTSPIGAWGAATEVSRGKDTPSGHWELAAVPGPWDWHYFPKTKPAFPDTLLQELAARAGIPGTLANCHASGIPVIEAFGAESITTGQPIAYTSADSVFQIAAHEEAFGLERLYRLSEIAADLLHPLRVGRVIARPFLGSAESGFARTASRKDFALPPPEPTLCDRVEAAGGRVFGIGKISDIFAGQGITVARKGASDQEHIDKTLVALEEAAPGDLIFTNLVDCDMLYGHRRDVAGYARNLEEIDARLPELFAKLREGDLLIITADHGNDPTWEGTDHTRERVPVLAIGPGLQPQSLGHCGFADVGESIAAHLGLPPGPHGRSLIA